MSRIARFWRHEVSIERMIGSSPRGDTYAAAVTHESWISDRRKRVVGASGEEVVSETTVYLPIETPAVPVGSKVTLPASFDGRRATVLAVSRHDSGGLSTADHLELALA